MGATIKAVAGTDNIIQILAVPFGGPFPNGKSGADTDGEYFSDRTDLCLDWFPTERPLLYDHGENTKTGIDVIGRIDSSTATKAADGWWVQAQLNRKSKYFDSIRALIDANGLYGSSGAMPHLVKRARDGEILRWPWVEQSLTPTPANIFARVQPGEAAKHYKSAGLYLNVKAGRVLSAANEKKIRDALAGLTAVLDSLDKA
jgi:hypothetical protein